MKTLIRFLLGAVFIVSGVAKAIDTQTFIGLVQAYDIGFLAYAAIIIPPLEILLGLFFWFNIEISIAALIMLISTVFFTLIFAEVLLTKGIQDCGCFGSIKFLKLPPWGTFLRNIVIITCSYYLYKFPPAQSSSSRKSKFIIISILGFAAFTVSAISFTKPLISVTAINHEDITGRDIESTPLKGTMHFDPKKRYAIFMYSPECFHCWDMTANVNSLTESGYVDETVGFAPFELMEQQKEYAAKLKPNFKVYFIPFSKFTAVTTSTPLLMIVEHNKVVLFNNTGVIHSGFTINKFMSHSQK